MSSIGIYFGTDTGTTRLIAKQLFRKLGADLAASPQNVNRTRVDDFLSHEALILGTPSYGFGDLPGLSAGCQEPSWEEFLRRLDDVDLRGKRVALFGLGNQEKYRNRFASSLIHLYHFFYGQGATIVGRCSTEGYDFEHSHAVVDGRFVGLVLDQRTQALLTEPRIDRWLADITPSLLGVRAQAA